ncbi:MAG: WD40 repeat domain-containing protein [Acidobacteriota bacterium]
MLRASDRRRWIRVVLVDGRLLAGTLAATMAVSAGGASVIAATAAAPKASDPLDLILSLLRYERAAGHEVSLVGDVRAVISAQLAYQAATGSYGELACLVRPGDCRAPAGTQSFLGAEQAAPQRVGYSRRLQVGGTAKAGRGAASFAYLAVPEQPGETGRHGFCGDDTGRVCYTEDGSEPALVDGHCAPSCREWDSGVLTAGRPKPTRAELLAALEAIDKDPRLMKQSDATKEAWRAVVNSALANQATGKPAAVPGSVHARGRAHEGSAGALAFTPDGRTLVTSSMDDQAAPIKLWSVADGRLSGRLPGPCPGVWALRVTPDGKSVLASCMDHAVRRWSLADRKLEGTVATHKSSMIDLGLSADGHLLVSAAAGLGEAGAAQLTALPAGSAVSTITLSASAGRVALSPDGRTLASAGPGAALQLWSLPDGKPAATLDRMEDVSSLAISPSGSVLAVATGPAITLWSLPERRQLGSLSGHGSPVNQLAFCPDGRLLSASSDDSIKLWSVSDRKLLATLRGHTAEVYGVAASPDGRLAASSDRSGVVVLWDLETKTQRLVFVDPGR